MPIITFDSQKLDVIRQKYNLKLILLHGSHVTGKFVHAKSDIDIAVVRQKDEHLDELSLVVELASIFGDSRIDLTDVTHGNPLLNMAVARKATLLAGSEPDLEVFQKKAFMRYGDYLPYLKLETELVKIKLQKYVTN